MSGASPMESIVAKYDDVIPIPVIIYNPANNALAFNNTVQTTPGIAPAESETLEFNSPATYNNTIRVGYNGDFPDSVPMISPLDSMSLIFPTIFRVGTIQATDLMIANNGATRLYSGEAGTHINGDITVVSNITNQNLQGQLDFQGAAS